MQGFVERLDEINALAEAAPGFVWRLKGEGNDATSLRPFDDDWLIVNMSVWETVESLKEYVYKSHHVQLLRQRKQWFSNLGEAHAVMWWVPKGDIPTIQEAKERLEYLRQHGPTPHAFSFSKPFTAPDLVQ